MQNKYSRGFGQSLSFNPVIPVPAMRISRKLKTLAIRPKSLMDDTQKFHKPADYLETQAKTRQSAFFSGWGGLSSLPPTRYLLA
jgi:hypothetical protein